jgi:hypothetical protein
MGLNPYQCKHVHTLSRIARISNLETTVTHVYYYSEMFEIKDRKQTLKNKKK